MGGIEERILSGVWTAVARDHHELPDLAGDEQQLCARKGNGECAHGSTCAGRSKARQEHQSCDRKRDIAEVKDGMPPGGLRTAADPRDDERDEEREPRRS
jgi:hypothetical protein